MEQHHVPQQISAYHFRLIGDMTIKQFLELIAGIIAAWIFYSIPLPSLFRWPLILLSVFLGVAFAFLPLEERPLDKWLIAFIKASYSPTKFLWKKKVTIPAFLEERPKRKPTEEPKEQADRKKLKEYIESLPGQRQQTPLDTQETDFINNIMNMYIDVQPTTAPQVKPMKQEVVDSTQEPEVKVRVRKLKTPPLNPKAIMRGEVIMPKRTRLSTKQFDIPTEKPIDIDKVEVKPENPPFTPPQTPTQAPITKSNLIDITPISTPKPPPPTKPLTAPVTPTNLPIPTLPTTPNVIVGMVIDRQGNIVENAIITIKDSQGKIERALKTNKIGQFFIATALKNGGYEIDVEKEGLTFDIININLEGKPVPPLQIKAHE